MTLLTTPSALVQAQDERPKVAQSYEQSGDYRSAARLWQSLYSENPSNEASYQGIVRCFKALNNYSALLEIAQDKLKRKKTIRVQLLIAQCFVKTGKSDEARSWWDEVMSSSEANAALYRDVAQAQIEVQQYEEAIRTLIKGRDRLDDPSIFAEELAQIYASRGDYKNGVQEVLIAFERNRNLQLAQGRLSAFMQNDSAKVFMKEAMSNAASRNDDSPQFLRLYEWFLREGRLYDDAFGVVQRIDKLIQAQGREVLMFADQCRMDGLQDLAMKAYSSLLEKQKKGEIAQLAAFGYAGSVESRFRDGRAVGEAEVRRVIELYRDIISTWPQSSSAADAQLRIARCYASYLANPDKAVEEYTLLTKQYPMYPQALQARMEIGSCYVQQSKLDEAAASYKSLLSDPNLGRQPRLQQGLLFARGELYFFRAQYDSALADYARIEQSPESEFANDAIDRMTTIQINRKDTLLLQRLSTASLFATQLKLEDALRVFDELAGNTQNPDLAEVALIRSAELCMQARRTAEVHKRVRALAQRNVESIYADKALFLDAEASSVEGNIQEAVQGYTNLLNSFPRSLYVQDARERIRKLRGGM